MFSKLSVVTKSSFYRCAVAIAVFLISSSIFYSYFRMGDDTYIYVQYCKNLLNNHELAFNPGIRSYGFTSPLWFLFIVIGTFLIGHPLLVPSLISLLFESLSIVVWDKILQQSKISEKYILPLLLIISIDPNLLKHSYLGMESAATFFLMSLFIYSIFTKENILHPALYGILGGVFYFIRPESLMIWGLLSLYLLIYKKYTLPNILLASLALVITLLPWMIFSKSYFGFYFASTFAAKGGVLTPGLKFWGHISDSLKIFFGNYIFYFLIFLVLVIKDRKFIKHPAVIFTFVAVIISVLFYSLVLNDEVVYARYYCMVFPLILFVMVLIFSKWQDKISRYIIKVLIPMLFVGFLMLTYQYSGILRKIFIPAEETETRIAEWVIQNTPKDSKIMRGRIGKIAYITGRFIVDPVGFTNPDVIPYKITGTPEKYYDKVKPDYYIGKHNDILAKTNMRTCEVLKIFPINRTVSVRINILGNENETFDEIICKLNWQ